MTALRTVDYHTGGEPFRIVTGGVEQPQGTTILERRRDALERLDHVRRLLVHEPRGHADMYGCHVVPGNDAGADLGVVFFHNAGYSTACGHGTIALVTWALDEGIVERHEGENRVVVDVPSGRLETVADVRDGRVRSVTFRNVPSFVWGTGVRVGEAVVDIAFGGAFYATLRERVEPAELRHLSIVGSSFVGRVVDAAAVAGRPAVITEVTGSAYRTGESTFRLDPDDPLGDRSTSPSANTVTLRWVSGASPSCCQKITP